MNFENENCQIILENNELDSDSIYEISNPIVRLNYDSSKIVVCKSNEYLLLMECKEKTNILNVYLSPLKNNNEVYL